MQSEEEKEKFELMERRDEEQIQKAVMGEYLEEFIYDFTTKSGHRVTGLSWVGVKEIAARMGHIRCDDKPELQDQGESWLVMVKAEDRLRDSSRWGVSTQSKKMALKDGRIIDDDFAIQKAMSKAQRNAIRQLIPEKWINIVIERYLKGEKFEPEKSIPEAPKPTKFDVPVQKPTLGKVLDATPIDVGTPGHPKGHPAQLNIEGLVSPERTPQSRSCTGNQAANITTMCRTYKNKFGYDPTKDILERNGVAYLQAMTFDQAEKAIEWLEKLLR